MKNFFLRLSIKHKLMIIFFSIMILGGLLIVLVILPKFTEVMHAEKKIGLKHNVEMIYNLLEEYNTRYIKGEFTLEESQKRAIQRIKTMKYQEGSNYFWINDTHPKMIMHPTNPKLDGTDLTDYKDPKGKNIFVEMKKVVLEHGMGSVEYQWKKVNSDEISDKISYVRLYKPWGWVIGTGIWLNEIDPEIKGEINWIYYESYIGLGLIFLFIIVISYMFSNYLNKRFALINKMAELITNGDLESVDKLLK